jgi:hypothetical protein
MPKQFNIEGFNQILKEYNQQLRAETISSREIILSNGLVLNSERDVRLCKKRVMIGNKAWKENFDRLYSINNKERNAVEKECRSITSKKGGISCQQQHKEKIKSNLNTGTPWNKGMKGKYPYSYACSEDTKKKISNANKGENNGMFGKKHSEEERCRISKIMKEKILLGEFTPNSNNKNTHWESFYKNKKYRSSWEALYHYFDSDAEYESLRVPYSFQNKDYIYIIDFVNHKSKTVIEVKPQELVNDNKTQAKISAAKEWCNINGYTFVLADKNYLLSKSMPTTLKDFDSKTQNRIRNLYETN